ncbi:Hypothetical protein PBC10988_14980 [Planctomycetales bacterium 10988]|nr:Hypothetical protein PBC10988_14980 [Planctomycetales bacterium 10988]
MRIYLLSLAMTFATLGPGLATAQVGNQEANLAIANAVASRLEAAKDSLEDYDIDIRFKDGVCWLRGQVGTREQLFQAIAIAKNTEGVRQVINELEVVPHLEQPTAAPSQVSKLPPVATTQSMPTQPQPVARPARPMAPLAPPVQTASLPASMPSHVQQKPMQPMVQMPKVQPVQQVPTGELPTVRHLTQAGPAVRPSAMPEATMPQHQEQPVTPTRYQPQPTQKTPAQTVAQTTQKPAQTESQPRVPQRPIPVQHATHPSQGTQFHQIASPQAPPVMYPTHAQPMPGAPVHSQQVSGPQMMPPQQMQHMQQMPPQQMQMASYPGAAMHAGGYPMPMHGPSAIPVGYSHGAAGHPVPGCYDQPHMPNYAWPSYAPYPNYAAVGYPQTYSAAAWPYIGPFYPYPQVPLGWRKVSLEWDDGWWWLDFDDHGWKH